MNVESTPPREPHHPAGLLPDAAGDDSRQWLSALLDGQADAVAPACARWREDAGARQAWHAYHLIGDVMRSEELASTPARDAAFVARLRGSMAAEPVVMAPTALAPAPSRSRKPWLMPATAAAGFALVAGVLAIARPGIPGGLSIGGPRLASSSAPATAADGRLLNVASPGLLQSGQRLQGATFIRDPRLDEFLRAHQQPGRGYRSLQGGLRAVDDVAAPVAVER